MMSGRKGMLGVLGLVSTLSACAPGPRFEASWFLVHEPVAGKTEVWVDPNPPLPGATPEPAPPPAPAAAAKAAEGIYVSIRNLGRPVEIAQVLLSADNQSLQRVEPGRTPYVLRHGEVLVLRMDQPETGPPRTCLIPARLTVTTSAPKRKIRTLKVSGESPTSLPDEWIEQCTGRRSAMPKARVKGRR